MDGVTITFGGVWYDTPKYDNLDEGDSTSQS